MDPIDELGEFWERRVRTNEVLGRLRHYIEDSGLSEQQRLPPERELAALLGLTRNRLRGGLRKLATEGLVWRHVGKGTYVGPRPVQTAGRQLMPVLGDLTNPREVMEARLAFEPELARLAAFRASAREFADMDQCIAKMTTATRWESWETWDGRLHRSIAAGTGNTLLLALFDTVQANRNKEIWGKLREAYKVGPRMQTATHEHAEIVAAIRARDPDEAAERMRRHLRAVRKSIFGEN